ncbi:unnamed protein product [Pieris brassicae]|uniref:Peptidase S1 domain-containing protein n=1 Tax=Pieris brassicae TaxID=7116 RepID=A0A9P0XEZ2_PIEBR|nr:unnamed protein product [Pieris brassicae]
MESRIHYLKTNKKIFLHFFVINKRHFKHKPAHHNTLTQHQQIISIRYWPDVYNYINANITIKRIPTITELNVTYYEETTDDATTEYILDTTIEESTDYFSLEDVEMKRDKRRVEIEVDYVQLPKMGVVDYFFEFEATTIEMLDLVDEDKLTTNMDIDSESLKESFIMYNDSCPLGTTDDVTSVFSWIAAIFVKNGTNQFQYDCDGALLSTNIIVTAARCVNLTRAEDIVVILGKASLQNMKENEKILKISEVIVHENYTSSTNDIAVLKTEEVVDTTETILFACLSDGQEFTDAATTGWAVSGELTAIHFDKDKSQQCSAEDVCAVYGNDITVCPSFGGVYAVKQGGWYLHGIRTEIEPFHQSLCLNKPLHYTPLNLYTDWIYNL